MPSTYVLARRLAEHVCAGIVSTNMVRDALVITIYRMRRDPIVIGDRDFAIAITTALAIVETDGAAKGRAA